MTLVKSGPTAAGARGKVVVPVPPGQGRASAQLSPIPEPLYIPGRAPAIEHAAIVLGFLFRLVVIGISILAPLSLLWLEQCIYQGICL